MKKLLLTLISSLSILSAISFATAQVKQASQYAKIETTEVGAPVVGNATELSYTCSGATNMRITKSYTYNNIPVEIFNMNIPSTVVFRRFLPAELGTKYDLLCSTESKFVMTDSYKTPDYLPQGITISADKTTLNKGETVTVKVQSFLNGTFDSCDVYFDSNKVASLTGPMNSMTYSREYMSMGAGYHNVYYKCSYINNSIGKATADSNNILIKRNADPTPDPTACTTVYKPVCGQPKMPICTKDMACPQVMPTPKTYSNKCELDRVGATYLYDGVCTSDEVPAITACPTGTFNLKDTCQCPTGQVLTRVGQDSTGRDLYSCLSKAPVVTICPTGVFTNSDCTCQNGQQPTAIPSGTRIQQFTCDVKDTACTDVYKPVCGQPKTCNSSLGYCLDVMQKPQTYSNICALTSAGATYLYDGTCDGAKTNLIQKSSTTPPTIPNIPNNNDVDNGDDNNTGGVCVSLTANMRFRSRDNSTGGEVSKLQNFLISSGYLTGSATGYFGNATQAAVKSYQAANGLAVSGIVGQYTRAKIVDSCSNSNSAVDEPLPLGLPYSTSTSLQPKADVITQIDMRSLSGGFIVSPVKVTNGVKMTAEFKTNDFRFDGQYYIRLMYKNSSKQCILTGSFQPIANKTYKIERTSESACILGGNIGDLSNVDYFEIAKQ